MVPLQRLRMVSRLQFPLRQKLVGVWGYWTTSIVHLPHWGPLACLPRHELIPKVTGPKLGTILNGFIAPGMSHPASWLPSSVSSLPSPRLWHFPLPSHLESELHKDKTRVSFQFHMFSLLELSLWLPQLSLPLNQRSSTIPLSAPLLL